MDQPKRLSFAFVPAIIINCVGVIIGVAVSWSSSAIPVLSGRKPGENPLPQPATKTEQSLIISLMSFGLMFGPILAPSIDKIGRKKSLLSTIVAYVIINLMIGFARRVWLLCLARLLFGITNGWLMAIIPNYVAELAEKHNRGTLTGLFKISLTFGMFLNYCMGPYLSILLSSVACLVHLILVSILIFVYVPESPYYLVAKGDKAGAESALIKLRRRKDVREELEEIVVGVEKSFERKRSVWEIFTNFPLLKCLLIGFGLMSFQQLNGSSPVLFNLQSIFEPVGSEISPEVSAIIVGFIQFLSSIFSPLLVDRLGRRILLLFSASGSMLSLIALGTYFYLKTHHYPTDSINWLPITSLLLFFLSYAMGFGPLPFTIVSEIFPPKFKAVAASLTISWLGLNTFAVTMTFPFLSDLLGMGECFWIFAGFCAAGLVFVYLCVPETKNKSFLEIQRMLKIFLTEVD